MTCIHCGECPIAMEYTFRCDHETRAPAVIDIHVCLECLQELRAQPDMELIESSSTLVAE